VGSLTANMATANGLPREQATKALVSLQRVIDGRRIDGPVAVEVSEKLASLDRETLNLRREGTAVEVVVHVSHYTLEGVSSQEEKRENQSQ